MPSKEEIDRLLGENSEEKSEENSEEKIERKSATEEDYKDAVDSHEQVDYKKQYEELRKLEAKREKELHDLREKARLLDSNDDDDSEEKTEVLTKEEVQKQINEGIARIDKARALQSSLQSAVSKYSFVDEKDTLDFIKSKGGRLTVEEAITLKYPNELLAYQRSNANSDMSETDAGGRTLVTKQNDTEEHGELRKGFPIRRNDDNGMQRFIGSKLTENLKRISGMR